LHQIVFKLQQIVFKLQQIVFKLQQIHPLDRCLSFFVTFGTQSVQWWNLYTSEIRS
jgi:hypothetical protein